MIINGNCLDELDKIDEDSIDSIVTDPPYELNFMSKGWDNAGVSFNKTTWEKCVRVLKPGGYLLAFGGSRTFHRIACAIEDAGFEIRDCIMWLYGSGFPKSMNIGLAVDKKNGVDNRTGNIKTDGKATNSGSGCYNCNNGKDNSMKQEYEERIAQNEWQGWGTCLKPSFEPIIVARKPFKGSLVDNVMKYGVGGINIDECRVPLENGETKRGGFGQAKTGFQKGIGNSGDKDYKCEWVENTQGRFPANTILDTQEGEEWRRYFYCAKASRKDRDEGLEEFEEKKTGVLQGGRKEGSAGSIMLNENGTTRVNPYAGTGAPKKNSHPTVKPTALMQYLIRLVTPKGATVLDPFMGSGSTGKAVAYENIERNANYKFIGIELDGQYCKIAEARIEGVEGERMKLRNKKTEEVM